jgi:hypothetical protein
VYHPAKKPEWMAFLRRKVRARMVKGVDEKLIPRGPGGEELWAGCFPVAKSWKKDRAVDERRRKNWAERRWRGDKPSHAVHFVRKILKPKRRVRYSKFDAPNFYHNLWPGPAHLPHNPTGPPITREEARSIGLIIEPGFDAGGDLIQPCATTVCMGAGNGCTLAQRGHRKMVKKAGLPAYKIMTWDLVDPRGDLRAALCIDDLVLEQEMDEDDDGPAEDTRITEALLELYDDLGIPPVVEKVELRARQTTALGGHLDGDSGRVGLPVRVLAQLMMVTLFVVSAGGMSKKAGEKLTGSWVFGLMFRRELFCVLSAVYLEVRQMQEKGTWPMSPSALSELLMLVIFAPMMRSYMRWQVSPVLFATDATGSGTSAMTQATVSTTFAEELLRYAPLKGLRSWMCGDEMQVKEDEALAARCAREAGVPPALGEEAGMVEAESPGKNEVLLEDPGHSSDEDEERDGGNKHESMELVEGAGEAGRGVILEADALELKRKV